MIEELRTRFPWPEAKPDVPPRMHGWHKKCVAKMFRRFITPETKIVVELGSWLGESATDILKCSGNLTLICVDHWNGSDEHRKNEKCRKMLPTLYETFLVNMWEYRSRIIPVKASTYWAIPTLAMAWACPSMIYVDAAHDELSVFRDIHLCIRHFPKARITGDDWKWKSVRKGVKGCLKTYPSLTWKNDDDAWWIEKKS